MGKDTLRIFLLLVVFCFSVKVNSITAKDWIDSTLFSPKLFIENKGQFNPVLRDLNKLPSVKFAVNHAKTKIFFSDNMIAYTLFQRVRNEKALKEFQEEEAGHSGEGITAKELKEEQEFKSKIYEVKKATVYMEWVNANRDCKIEASEVADEYFNYGMSSNIQEDINFVKGFKKIVYKNIYDGIDIEYTFHERTGIKYTILAHPGADISKIKLKYSSAQSVSLDEKNNVIIKTALGDITDHAPISYYDDGGEIESAFVLENNIVSFNLKFPISSGLNRNKSVVIDPWVTTTGPELDTAYEIAVDPAGNVFVYGDYNSQVKKYDNTGAAQWTYLAGPGWWFNATVFGGDITVDPAGNSYFSGSADVRKLNPAGTSLWILNVARDITTLGCQELGWRMIYDVNNNLLYGTGSNGQCKATTYNPATGVANWTWGNPCKIITPPCTTSCPNSNGEVRHLTLAPNGNFYGYTAVGDGGSFNWISTITGFDTSLTGIYRSCSVPSSPYWIGGTYFYGAFYMGNGIAASNCNIYIYEGDRVYKYDIYTPAQLGTGAIANGAHLLNSGILADLMNNFYVGTQTGISVYDPNFNLITSTATSKPVYDMAFAPGNNIAACGIGFVGVFSSLVQTGSPITCSKPANLPMTATGASSPSGCSTNTGQAWIATIKDGAAPYTYSWSSGATTDTINSLTPGTYACIIKDSSCPRETTTVTVTVSGSSLVITVPRDYYMCAEGSAGVTLTASGGTSYTWSPGATLDDSTIAGPFASPLITTTYTVTVKNGPCSDTAHVTVHIVQPPSPPVIYQKGDTLYIHPGFTSYQWYFNGTPISGATDTLHIAIQTGDYAINVSDSLGCSVITNATHVIVGVEELEESAIEIYPNPAKDILIISHPSMVISKVEVFNVLAEKILTQSETGNQKTEISVSSLNDGIYLVKINFQGRSVNKRIVVVHD